MKLSQKFYDAVVDRIHELGLNLSWFDPIDFDLFIKGKATLVVVDGKGLDKRVMVVAHD